MPDVQILSIDLGVAPVGATAFRLRFSPNGGEVWINYNTSDPAGVIAEELPLSDLSGTVYRLDGINNPTGNQAAASEVGNLLAAAWKVAGLWSQWGPEAEAVANTAPGRVTGSYTSPTTDQIINRSGINTRMERYVQGDLVSSLTALIPDAETRTALAVGVALFASTTLTGFQIAGLQIAVSKRVISDFLRRVAVQWASGTQAPRERINPEELFTLAEAFEKDAETYDDLVVGIIEEAGEAGELLTGEIVTSTPNEYLDSYRPDWRGLVPAEVVIE